LDGGRPGQPPFLQNIQSQGRLHDSTDAELFGPVCWPIARIRDRIDAGVVLAEIQPTGTRAGTALRTDGGRLLAAGIVEIAVKPGCELPCANAAPDNPKVRQLYD
jgi:hypothetical protein